MNLLELFHAYLALSRTEEDLSARCLWLLRLKLVSVTWADCAYRSRLATMESEVKQ